MCNHPELFERRDAKSPIHIAPCVLQIPYLIYDFNVFAKMFVILQKCFIFTPEYIKDAVRDNFNDTIFSIYKALNLSFYEFYMLLQGDIKTRWTHYFNSEKEDEVLYHRKFWSDYIKPSIRIMNEFKLTNANIETSSILQDLIFTRKNSGNRVFYKHTDQYYYPMPETLEHRNIRCKNALSNEEDTIIDVVTDESPLIEELVSTQLKLSLINILIIIRNPKVANLALTKKKHLAYKNVN